MKFYRAEMTFSESEIAYLRSQRLGRLATAQPDGTLQVSPVGFRLDESAEMLEKMRSRS